MHDINWKILLCLDAWMQCMFHRSKLDYVFNVDFNLWWRLFWLNLCCTHLPSVLLGIHKSIQVCIIYYQSWSFLWSPQTVSKSGYMEYKISVLIALYLSSSFSIHTEEAKHKLCDHFHAYWSTNLLLYYSLFIFVSMCASLNVAYTSSFLPNNCSIHPFIINWNRRLGKNGAVSNPLRNSISALPSTNMNV